MCRAMRELMKDELDEKEQETKLIDIKKMMKNLKLTTEQATQALEIPQDM